MHAPNKEQAASSGSPDTARRAIDAPFLRIDEVRKIVGETEPLPPETIRALWELETFLRDTDLRERMRSRGVAQAFSQLPLVLVAGLFLLLANLRRKQDAETLAVAVEAERDDAHLLADFDASGTDPATRSALVAFVKIHAERVCASLERTSWMRPWARLCAESARYTILARWLFIEGNYLRFRNEAARDRVLRRESGDAS